jgi:hypothetical protein
MANNNNCDKFDINVQNISKQYGSPRETFEILKATINNTFGIIGQIWSNIQRQNSVQSRVNQKYIFRIYNNERYKHA